MYDTDTVHCHAMWTKSCTLWVWYRGKVAHRRKVEVEGSHCRSAIDGKLYIAHAYARDRGNGKASEMEALTAAKQQRLSFPGKCSSEYDFTSR